MANQYTLTIDQLVCGQPPAVPPPAGSPPGTASTPGSWPAGYTNVVTQIVYHIDGTDGAGHNYTVGGTTQLGAPPATNCIQYAQLTPAWAQSIVQADPAYPSKIAGIDSQIANQIKPPIVTPPLPWMTTPVREV